MNFQFATVNEWDMVGELRKLGAYQNCCNGIVNLA